MNFDELDARIWGVETAHDHANCSTISEEKNRAPDPMLIELFEDPEAWRPTLHL
jgi:hypothetical protein